jgi:methionyl aminopeptidase
MSVTSNPTTRSRRCASPAAGRRGAGDDRRARPARHHHRRAGPHLPRLHRRRAAGIPAPLNYRGFPRSICTSVNNQVCHGIPGNKRLKKGDIVNIDITVIKDGYHGDTSKMFFVGEPSVLARGWFGHPAGHVSGIDRCGPGPRSATSATPSRPSSKPQILGGARVLRPRHRPRVPRRAPGAALRQARRRPGAEPGMCFTIEPMVNAGKRQVKLLPDGWTVVTKDRSLSAQWEHTILVTRRHEILTLRDEERAAAESAGPCTAQSPAHRRSTPNPPSAAMTQSRPCQAVRANQPRDPPNIAEFKAEPARSGPDRACSSASTRRVRSPIWWAATAATGRSAHHRRLARFIPARSRPPWPPSAAMARRAASKLRHRPADPRRRAEARGASAEPSGLVIFLWDIGLEIGHSVRTVETAARGRAPTSPSSPTCSRRASSTATRRCSTHARSPSARTASGRARRSSRPSARNSGALAQVRRHRLQPGAQHQGESRRPARHPDDRLGDQAPLRRRLPARARRTRLPDRGRVPRPDRGQALLWRIRFALHRLTGRREDRLLFDYQRTLADEFGYSDPATTWPSSSSCSSTTGR